MNRFRNAVKSGEFLVTAEVAPPKGADPAHMIEMASTLKGRVHAVNVTDGSRAVLRMSSLAASIILKNNGIDPICQVACRDRNRIGLQADLMGASALGLHNILALTGDPVKAGDHKDARSVFDMESVRLLQMIAKLNQGIDWNEKTLPDGATDLFVGAAVDPQSPSWSGLKKRFERKLLAGCQFFQSQLISDFDKLEKFMNQIAVESNKPILAGIFLLKSAKNAAFINKYVPGVDIPEHIINRLAKAEKPLEEGIKIAAEQVQIASKICHGVHLMAIKREDLIPRILDMAEISPIEQ
ncbi:MULTISPECIES: methylenetetrahydrofolate reductase [Okeania]|uniref:Methylenetetrahydrofolate reductase n=1 Tax=Okeania hirsuta TaxID=1458930 RepID=A0A3N6NVY9_9CYAN|nr:MULTISPECIES: methylenetetrahydrofolate reductase [Okeania]NET16285.1 methylenetetrahydrofolate reductase [Okeania sp. SIO1H6]NES79570.1 methylenetetrahydrofolate reductase [Okeania sp. SIO1H4]NES88393.1 methylenetetrahydrofolate reductase [Okeania sp. SIO2B9]NET23241.1 methylenetetrahydrofolate reductase [Okeania sp. SIO1H5]NET79876.1 methylenetetrahydrofolate reductase [Okeania sp. SIO1F9]